MILSSFKSKSFTVEYTERKVLTTISKFSSYLYHIKRNMSNNTCTAAKILKTSGKCCITRSLFKLFHFLKHQLIFNFIRGLGQPRYCWQSLNFRVTVDLQVKHCVKSVLIWKFSGPYFLVFGLNTTRYGVSLRIQSKCGKIQTRQIPNTDFFHSVKRVRKS